MRIGTIITIVALTTAVVCGAIAHHYVGEYSRLQRNHEVLLGDVELYRTAANESAASVGILRLRVEELRRLRSEDAERIRELGIRLRRAESYSKSALTTTLSSTLLLRDTIVVHDTLRMFEGGDAWSTMSGEVRGDSIRYTLRSIDTLHQVVHRIPRRFLFFRWGTKALRQEIVSSNPHTTLVYSEYIEIERGS